MTDAHGGGGGGGSKILPLLAVAAAVLLLFGLFQTAVHTAVEDTLKAVGAGSRSGAQTSTGAYQAQTTRPSVTLQSLEWTGSARDRFNRAYPTYAAWRLYRVPQDFPKGALAECSNQNAFSILVDLRITRVWPNGMPAAYEHDANRRLCVPVTFSG